MAKGGSKVFTAIIAFLLGFIFAILVEAGAIFGVYWFVMNKDLDTIMSTVGINNRDEEGNNKYINTDPENGGVTNMKELIGALQGLVYENGEVTALGKSLDDFENLIPATKMVLNLVYNTVDGYIELDREEFESTPLSGLAQVLSDSLMNVKTAALLEKLNMNSITGDDANAIVKSLLMGSETEYATVSYAVTYAETEGGEEQPSQPVQTFKLPVLYDYYIYDASLDAYYREQPDRASRYPQNLEGREEDLLCEELKDDEDGEFTNRRFKLYFVPCRVTETEILEAEYRTGEYVYTDGNGKEYRFSVLEFGEDTDFIAIKPQPDGSYIINHAEVYAALNAEKAADYSYRFTGYSYDVNYASSYYYDVQNSSTEKREIKSICGKNYFRDNAGKLNQLDALTVGDLISDTFGPLDSVPAYSVVGDDGSGVAYKVFGKTSLGELMRGEVDFNKLINDMEIGTVITNVPPDNKVMCYVAYKISDLTPNPDGTYSAIYDKFGANEKVTVYIDGGNISEVKRGDGTLVEGVKVNQVASMASDMPITVLMDVTVDDAIMTYLGYGVSGMKAAAADSAGNPCDYIGNVRVDGNKVPCYITVNGDGALTDVWYFDGDNKVAVAGTKVSQISSRLDNLTDDLTIRDVIEVGEDDRLMNAIADEPISNIGNAVKDVTVDKLFTPEQVQKNAMLRELQGTKIGNLDEAIEGLMIQSIYFEEVYRLPSTADLMKVVDFDSGYKYYQIKEETVDGKKQYSFELANGDGALSEADFNARGKTVYYTKGETLGGEDLPDAPMMIVGFDETWLYYEADPENEGKHILTEATFWEASADKPAMTETEEDDARGHLDEETFKALDENGQRTTYYSYGYAKGMWNLVLFRNDKEKAYSMNNFNNMVSSCAQNVNDATLFTLQEAGIIASTVKLGNKFMGKELGEWTLGDLIQAISEASESAS